MAFFQGNEFFEGGLMLAILGGIIAALRFLPREIWRYLQRQITPTLYIRDEQLVRWVSDWLQDTEHRKTRWWMGEIRNYGEEGDRILLKPGEGLHIVRRFGTRFLVWSNLEDNGFAGKIHTVTIRCYGRDPAPLERLVEDARTLAKRREAGKNVTFVNDTWGEWKHVRLGEPRPLETVILRGGVLEEIAQDLETFLESRELYRARGVPYRRGYLLEGPPGNGKSTIAQCLATTYRLPIYSLTIADKDFSDTRLANAIGAVPERAVLLLEDADRLDFTQTGVTMTGLLNSIDGALASEGRILIVTANNPDKLDEAFKREGRLDRKWAIENPDHDSIVRMAQRFELGDCNTWASWAVHCGWSMAKVQGMLQRGDLSVPSGARGTLELQEVQR